jgi:hypothetical protein
MEVARARKEEIASLIEYCREVIADFESIKKQYVDKA